MGDALWPEGEEQRVTPSPENRADAAAIQRRCNAPAGWAAFRALRQRPAPIPLRRHGNHRHGRYAKRSVEEQLLFRRWRQLMRSGQW
jgi:hypothetical protein